MPSDSRNLHWRNQVGHLCEVIAAEALVRKGYWVFSTTMMGPVDLIAIRADPPEVRLIDVKSDRYRLVKGVMRRIHRLRTPSQKKLGVQLVYVDPDKGTTFFSTHKNTDEN